MLSIGFIVLFFSSILLNIIGFYWMLVIQIRNNHMAWSGISFFIGPFIFLTPSIVYGFLHFKEAYKPLFFLLLLYIILLSGYAYLSSTNPEMLEMLKEQYQAKTTEEISDTPSSWEQEE